MLNGLRVDRREQMATLNVIQKITAALVAVHPARDQDGFKRDGQCSVVGGAERVVGGYLVVRKRLWFRRKHSHWSESHMSTGGRGT